jgi:hypothetical protein
VAVSPCGVSEPLVGIPGEGDADGALDGATDGVPIVSEGLVSGTLVGELASEPVVGDSEGELYRLELDVGLDVGPARCPSEWEVGAAEDRSS